MYIEEFRKNNLGDQVCRILYPDDRHIDLALFHVRYAWTIFEDVTLHLKTLEDSSLQTIPIDNHALGTFTTIFNLAEVFISTIQILLFYNRELYIGITYKDVKKSVEQKFDKKISEILQTSLISPREFYKTDEYKYLQELTTYRNNLMHGNLVKRKPTHINLSEIPFKMNISDIMEAFQIVINLMNKFRFLIQDIDLMPIIPIMQDDVFYIEPLDVTYEKYLFPWYLAILDNYGLQTELKNIQTSQPLIPNYKTCNKAKAIVITKLDKKYVVNKNKNETNYSLNILEKICDKTKETPFLFPHINNYNPYLFK
ncbi:MAG: hypothetical protein BHW62_08035 [Acinetobacter sp. CAG:196_36_41]|nr:MAG: hypothetical protein BHW62_08035 [Acinetobacter sp. CAG:196_36_41]